MHLHWISSHMLVWWSRQWQFRVKVVGLRKISQGLVIITPSTQQPSYSPVRLHVLQARPMVTKIHPEIKWMQKKEKVKQNEKENTAWKRKVLNHIIVRTLAAVSIPVCKVFIAPEMMLIWLYLAICCDVLKHHGEFHKSLADRQGAAAKNPSKTENRSGRFKGIKLECYGQQRIQIFPRNSHNYFHSRGLYKPSQSHL